MIAVLDAVQQRQQQHEDRYNALIDDLVAGREIDASEIETILRDSGKSLADLRSLVTTKQRRAAMRAELAKLTELEAQRASLTAQVETATREFEAAKQRFFATVQPVNAEHQRVSMEISRLSGIPGELHRGCSCESLAAQESIISHRCAEAGRQVQTCRDNLHRLKQSHEDACQRGDKTQYAGAVARAQEALDAAILEHQRVVEQSHEIYAAKVAW